MRTALKRHLERLEDGSLADSGKPRKRVPPDSGQVGKEHMAGVSDDGIATGNGSRPSLQWWIATPFESLVPSFVPKSVVTVGSFIAG